jgi:Ca2+/Na+ antiporter
MQNIGFVYTSILLLSFLFFVFSQLTLQFSISVIIIILLSYYFGIYYRKKLDEQDETNQELSKAIDKDIGDRKETFAKFVSLGVVPKELKFLKKNKKLMRILTNIDFVKKFDKTRYSDILLNANQLMKIYIYTLSQRYTIINGLTLFVDIRDNIIELLYSVIMVVPQNVKHSYGFEPYQEIDKTIEDFLDTSRKMLEILEKFSIKQKELYIPDTKYKPYNSVKDTMFP